MGNCLLQLRRVCAHNLIDSDKRVKIEIFYCNRICRTLSLFGIGVCESDRKYIAEANYCV